MLAQVMGAGAMRGISLGVAFSDWRGAAEGTAGGTTVVLVSTHLTGSIRGSLRWTFLTFDFAANAGFAGV